MDVQIKRERKKGDTGKDIQFLNSFLDAYFHESKFLDNDFKEYFVYDFKYHFNKYKKRSPQLNLFDDTTEEKLKVFQKENKLDPTGILDKNSINVIKKPRCFTNFSFPNVNPKPSTSDNKFRNAQPDDFENEFRIAPQDHKLLGLGYKTDLKYIIVNSGKDLPIEIIRNIIEDIIEQISTYTEFSFQEAENIINADIEISFQKKIQAKYPKVTTSPWVPGNEVGRTFPPRIDYYNLKREVIINDNYNWTDDISLVQNNPNYLDVCAVLIHEFGHAVGLSHDDSHPEAIMYSQHANFARKYVQDDVNGLRFIYNNISELRKTLGLN